MGGTGQEDHGSQNFPHEKLLKEIDMLPWKKIKSQELHVCLSQGPSLKKGISFFKGAESLWEEVLGKRSEPAQLKICITPLIETKEQHCCHARGEVKHSAERSEAGLQMIPDYVLPQPEDSNTSLSSSIHFQ